ncbi:hypothetical protein [Methylobacterium currus]|uniref:hypothetical protein n=1 Tax=Methylobacterium currus TaxID=2051553 RepID=UPI000F513279|nr:hypothetical protein [Methylobacterium currus]
MQKLRNYLYDLCVKEMHPRDGYAIMELVDKRIAVLEDLDREEQEAAAYCTYARPEDHADLMADLPAAGERLHAAWEAGLLPDFMGRGGRKIMLQFQDALRRGVLTVWKVDDLRRWIAEIDEAYARIPAKGSKMSTKTMQEG